MANYVYLAQSLDGYIADKDHSVDWLDRYVDTPEGNDMGYAEQMAKVDALVMGRKTADFVLAATQSWPYDKPVFVYSNTWQTAPEGLEDRIFLVSGTAREVVAQLAQKGFNDLYIDGGLTITSFLREDLIDEMVITTVPVILGGGIALFGALDKPLRFAHRAAKRFNQTVVQNHYVRVR